jgi:hypothetical protein
MPPAPYAGRGAKGSRRLAAKDRYKLGIVESHRRVPELASSKVRGLAALGPCLKVLFEEDSNQTDLPAARGLGRHSGSDVKDVTPLGRIRIIPILQPPLLGPTRIVPILPPPLLVLGRTVLSALVLLALQASHIVSALILLALQASRVELSLIGPILIGPILQLSLIGPILQLSLIGGIVRAGRARHSDDNYRKPE